MYQKTPTFKDFLKHRQEVIDAEMAKEQQKKALYNERSFFPAFMDDLKAAEKEVIIFSPFISKFRYDYFKKALKELRKRNVAVFIFTRPVEEHERFVRVEIITVLKDYEEMGVNIFYLKGSIHEKLAIIDRKILWEGSLNILSQRSSRELMRRIFGEDSAKEVMSYLKINKELADVYKLKNKKLYQELAYDSKQNYIQKVKVLFTRVVVPFFSWWLSAAFRVIILSLKGTQMIASIIKFIF